MNRHPVRRARAAELVFLACAALATAPLLRAAPEDLREVLPADAPLVITIRSLEEVRTAWPGTPLARMWDEPSMKRYLAPLRQKLESGEWNDELREEMGASPLDLLEKVSGQLVVAIPSFTIPDKDADEDEPEFGVVVLADAGDEAESLAAMIVEADRKVGKEQMVERFRGLTLQTAVPSGGEHEGDLWWTRAGRHLMVASDRETLEAVAGAYLDDGLATNAAGSALAARIEKALPGAHLTAVLQTAGLMAQVSDRIAQEEKEEDNPMAPDPAAIAKALELGNIEGLAMAVRIGDDRLESFIDVAVKRWSGLLSLLAVGDRAPPPPPFVPASALTASVAAFSVPGLYDALLGLVDRINPIWTGMARGYLQKMNADQGIDVEGGLIRALGSSIVTFNGEPEGGPTPQLPMDAIYALALENPEAFTETVEKLKGLMGEESDMFEVTEFAGAKIHRLNIPMGPEETGGIAYAIAGRQALISTGSLRTLQLTLQQMADPRGSAWDRPDVRAFLDGLPAGTIAYGFTDTGKMIPLLVEAVTGAIEMAMGQMDMGEEDVDIDLGDDMEAEGAEDDPREFIDPDVELDGDALGPLWGMSYTWSRRSPDGLRSYTVQEYGRP